MNSRMIATIVRKDLVLFFKNRYFAVVTIAGLVAYTAIYYIMPRELDETLDIGIVAPELPPAFVSSLTDEGIDLNVQEDEETLRQAITDGDLPVGVVFPSDIAPTIAAGEQPEVQVYFNADLPEEFRDIYPILIEEWIALMIGTPLSIDATEHVLGPDRAGVQVPPRDRMLPMLAVFLLFVETLGLASLISSEIGEGTISALLVTPLQVEGLFVGKAIVGIGLAFTESTLLMAFTGGLTFQPAIILTALLIGSLLVTGLGFLVASISKDMMTVMGYGMVVLIVMGIPAFNVLLPGLTTDWIRILPSYYLVDTVHQVLNFGAGWGEVASNLAILLASSIAICGFGVLVLRRRYR
jgi:ABC-2 type transport system permease protein